MSHVLPQAQYAHIFYELNHTDPMYADQHTDPNLIYLPFTEKYVRYIHDMWLQQAHKDAKMLFAHPEVLTVTPAMITLMSEIGWGLNVWDYRRAFDDKLVQDYRGLYTLCQTRNVPITFITDYIPEMKHALQIG